MPEIHTLKQARERVVQIKAEVGGLLETAKAEGRDLTDDEAARVDTLADEHDKLQQEYPGANRLTDLPDPQASQRRFLRAIGAPTAGTSRASRRSDDQLAWTDAEGRVVPVLESTDSYADLVAGDDELWGHRFDPGELSLGRVARALITGDWRHAEIEAAAMGGTSGASGGYMVPPQVAARVVDQARAQSVVLRAGARTIAMKYGNLNIVRITGDPSLVPKAENEKFSGTSVTFGNILLKAHTIGNVVEVSRELAEDAPNSSQVIEQTLAAALAAEIDRLAIQGSGVGMPIGLLTLDLVQEVGSVGAIAYEDFLSAIEKVENENGQPNAYILSPAVKADLAELTTGDGSTSAKNWLGPPPDLAALARFSTKNCPGDSAVVGDFQWFAFAITHGARIEVSTDAGEAFERHQVRIKITWRGDTAILRPKHFCKLTGITT